MFITSALLYISSVLLSSVFLKLTFLFFCGYFSAHPTLAVVDISPTPVTHSRRPDQAGKAQKNNRPGIAPGRPEIYFIV
jgi:hypothetical protein